MTADSARKTNRRDWAAILRRLGAAVVAVVLIVFLGRQVWKARVVRAARADTVCKNELRYLGFALENYHDAYKAYPAAHADGHSWRIRMLPYILSSPQFTEYDFDQPWSAEHNMVHTRPLPSGKGPFPDATSVYGQPYGPTHDEQEYPAAISFLMIVGEGAFGHPTRQRLVSEIIDGLENTIAVVEVADNSVHWLSPTDLDIETMSFKINDGPQSFSSRRPRGPYVLFCDGTVCRLHPETPPELVRALCTIDGGEDLSRDLLVQQGLLHRRPSPGIRVACVTESPACRLTIR